MKTKKTGFAGFILFVLATSGLFLTCEVGLGNSVDTKPPTISISYPSTTSIMSGDFVIAGGANDETSLASVTLTMKNLANDATVGTWNASINNDNKTWSCPIGNSPSATALAPIADGKYQITAVATDGANRTTTVSETYYIDNTPPVVVVTRPSTQGPTASPDPFGSDLTFTGTLWDSHECSSITIKFYKTDGTLITQFTTQNVLQNWTITVPQVNFDALQTAMIDSKSSQKYFYTLSASDNAFKYTDNNGSAVTMTGNASSHIFLSDDISSLLSVGESFPTREILSNIDMGKLKQDGTPFTSGSITNANLASLRINSNTCDTARCGSFSIDPNNKNPTVDVAGFNWFAGTTFDTGYTSNQVAGKSVLSITVSQGLSAAAINTDQLYVYLRAKDDTNRVATIAEKISPSAISSAGTKKVINYSIDKTSGSWILVVDAIDQAGYTTMRRDTYSTLYAGKHYSEYAFTINGSMPYIAKLNPDNGETSKVRPNANQKFDITVSGHDSDTQDTILTVNKIGSNGDSVKLLDKPATGSASSISGFDQTWTLSLDAALEGSSVTYSYIVNDGKFPSSPITRTYITDTTVPTGVISKPVKDSTGKVLLSATGVQIKGSQQGASDLSSAQICFTSQDDASSFPGASAKWVDAAIQTETDGTNLTKIFSGDLVLKRADENNPEGYYYLWYRLADETGVYGDITNVYGTTASPFKVYVDYTDPVATMEIGSTANGFLDASVSYRETNFTLSGIDVDNGKTSGRMASSVSLSYVFTDLNNVIKPIVTVSLTDTGLNDGTWSYTQPVDTTTGHANDGLYEYTLSVTDSVGKVSTAMKRVRIDTTGPDLKVNNLTTNASITESNFPVYGSAFDVSGLKIDTDTKPWVKFSTAATPVWSSAAKVTSPDQSWNYLITGLTEGSGTTLMFSAMDRLGNATTSSSYTIYYDSAPPDLKETTINSTDTQIRNDASVSLGGTLYDGNALRVSSPVVVGVTRDGINIPAPTVNYTGSDIDTDLKNCTWNCSVDTSTDGVYVVTITGTDIAGKTSVVTRTIQRDTVRPSILAGSLSGWKENSISISGTANDSGSGIVSVQYQIDSIAGTWLSIDGTSTWSKTLDISALAETTVLIPTRYIFGLWTRPETIAAMALFSPIQHLICQLTERLRH